MAEAPVDPAPVFRHPTPIAPRPNNEVQKTMTLDGMPKWRRRGRPRLADRRVVVQRLLPLLPKLPPPSNLIPVKIVPNSPPAPPRILPKPPPTSTSDLSMFYVLSESNGQFFFHDGDRRIPITPLPRDPRPQDEDSKDDVKLEDFEATETTVGHPDAGLPNDAAGSANDAGGMTNETVGITSEVGDMPKAAGGMPDEAGGLLNDAGGTPKESRSVPQGEVAVSNGGKPATEADIGSFLPSESLSLSPSRLLRDTDGWFEGAVQDFSLSSFLGHLEGRPQPSLAVDSQLQSLMAESSVDYVAKFADLAAEVTDEANLTGDLA